MSCLNPLVSILHINKDGIKCPRIVGQVTDKTPLDWFRGKYGDNFRLIPCGKCVSCMRSSARLWQIRIMCESLYHKCNYFITLTYASLPPKKPIKDHLRSFVKNMRNMYGKGIKFFGCGEVGSLHERSHYHIIVMMDEPIKDLEYLKRIGLNDLYVSDDIYMLWKRGIISVGELDVESAGYVARYSQKKRSNNQGEFCIMSRGLGLQYCIDNLDSLLDTDFIYVKGNKFQLPRYFIDKMIAKSKDLQKILAYKKRKEKRASDYRYNTLNSMQENDARINKKILEEEKVERKEVVIRDVI